MILEDHGDWAMIQHVGCTCSESAVFVVDPTTMENMVMLRYPEGYMEIHCPDCGVTGNVIGS